MSFQEILTKYRTVSFSERDMPRKNKLLSVQKLNAIITEYSVENLKTSCAYTDGGIDPLWLCFERAAIDQCESDTAMFSRYAVWAIIVRDNIIQAMHKIENDNVTEGEGLLIRAANCLSAFAEVQAYFDALKISEGCSRN